MSHAGQALVLIVALAASNFFYQLAFDREWVVALERSWFQAVAVCITVWVIR